ncbi:MAG: endonuclease/exonuclease/phosphatase family protein [Rubellimicrobium sp.]|nr:endonuclease/exonuclease/phosphatase family protein [Rubellimicrobium sp.]
MADALHPPHQAAAVVTGPRDLTVANYNIHTGFGSDLRRRPDRTRGVIAGLGADILALQEADRRFRTRRGVLDLPRIEAETGLRPVPLRHRSGRDAHGWHGNLLLLRAGTVEETRTIDLPGAEPRGAVVADLDIPGHGRLRVIAAHLGLTGRARAQQAEILAGEVTADGRPTILLGDLNEWRAGPQSTLAPLYARFGAPGMGRSFPAPLPMLALDRIFVSVEPQDFKVSVHADGAARIASDHLPLVARIRF